MPMVVFITDLAAQKRMHGTALQTHGFVEVTPSLQEGMGQTDLAINLPNSLVQLELLAMVVQEDRRNPEKELQIHLAIKMFQTPRAHKQNANLNFHR